MVSLHKVTTVLNYLYGFVGICWLIGTIAHTTMISKYGLQYDVRPNILCYVITLMILNNFFRGRAILIENRAENNKKELRRFAYLVFIYFLLQFVTDYMLETNSSDRLARVFKVDVMGNYDQLPVEMQRFVEISQKRYGCCGVFGWQDYKKAAADVPASCCSKLEFYSPLSYYVGELKKHVDRCTLDELERTKGCKEHLYDIIGLLDPSCLVVLQIAVLVIANIANAVQLLLMMFALILAERVSYKNLLSQTV